MGCSCKSVPVANNFDNLCQRKANPLGAYIRHIEQAVLQNKEWFLGDLENCCYEAADRGQEIAMKAVYLLI